MEMLVENADTGAPAKVVVKTKSGGVVAPGSRSIAAPDVAKPSKSREHHHHTHPRTAHHTHPRTRGKKQ